MEAPNVGEAAGSLRQALADAVDPELGPEYGLARSRLLLGLQELTDDRAFEVSAVGLVSSVEPTIRHTGGSGDRALDGAGGSWLLEHDTIAVLASIEKDWASKVRRELKRLDEFEHPHSSVIALTNQRTSPKARQALCALAERRGRRLTILDAGWVAERLLRPESDAERSALGLGPVRVSQLRSVEDSLTELSRPLHAELPPLIGRGAIVDRLVAGFETGTTTLLVGPGGIGKTRVALAAAASARRRAVVVPARAPVTAESLAEELADSDPVIVILDDAHRRPDLVSVVASLERRSAPTTLLMVTRPGFEAQCLTALDDTRFADEPQASIRVGRLSNRAIGRLIRASGELPFQGQHDEIVRLSQGNPLLALIARRQAAAGEVVRGTDSHRVFSAHIRNSLESIAARYRRRVKDLRAVATLIAAAQQYSREADSRLVGPTFLGLSTADFDSIAEDLADAGICIGTGSKASPYAVAPDLIAETLVRDAYCGGTRLTRGRYIAAWNGCLSELDAVAAAGVIGRVTAGDAALDPADRDGLIGWCLAAAEANPAHALQVARAVAVGIPEVAAALAESLLLSADESALSAETLVVLIELLARRYPTVSDGWPLLLDATELFFETRPTSAAIDSVRAHFGSIYPRVPVDRSDSDGAVLAHLQESLVEGVDEKWPVDPLDGFSSAAVAQTAACAAITLLTLGFELIQESPEDPKVVNFRELLLPPSDYTTAAIRSGVRLLSRAVPALPPNRILRAVESTNKLAGVAKGWLVFRAHPTESHRELAQEAMELLRVELRETATLLPVPIRSQLTVRLGSIWPGDAALSEFASVFAIDPPRRIEQRRDGERPEYTRQLADRFLRPDVVGPTLKRWSDWLGQAAEAGVSIDHLMLRDTMAVAAAKWPNELGAALDGMTGSDDPILPEAVDALIAIVDNLPAAAQARIDLWLGSGPMARAAMAGALARSQSSELHRERLSRLAIDPNSTVRRAVTAVAWSSPELWAKEVAVLAADGDVSSLWHVLMPLEYPDSGLAGMPTDFLDRFEAAVMSSARLEGTPDSHLADLLERFGAERPGIAVRWAFERMDASEAACVSPSRFRGVGLPYDDHLQILVRTTATESDRTHCLERFLGSSDELRYHWGELLDWLDGGSDVLTDAIVRGLSSRSTAGRDIARRILRHDVSWAAFERRAERVLALGADRKMLERLVRDREPQSWSGPRSVALQETLDAFAEMSSPKLARLVATANRLLLPEIERLAVQERFESEFGDERD